MSNFDVSTHARLGSNVEGAVRQIVIALTHEYGPGRNNAVRMATAMRAYRRDVGKYGTYNSFYTNRNAIDESIGTLLLEGVQHILNRFGDTKANRTRINEVFQAIEAEWNDEGHKLPPTKDYDKVRSAHLRIADTYEVRSRTAERSLTAVFCANRTTTTSQAQALAVLIRPGW